LTESLILRRMFIPGPLKTWGFYKNFKKNAILFLQQTYL
jgi:hypothetical protein